MVEHEAKVEDDATNASKDAEDLNREVRIKDVRILSAEAETGAVRGTSAGVLDSVTVSYTHLTLPTKRIV